MMDWIRRRLNDWAAARMRKCGYEPIRKDQVAESARLLRDSANYMGRSGHMNTVAGKRPRSVRRVMGSMLLAAESLRDGCYPVRAS